MDSLRREYSLFEKFRVWFGEKTVIVFTMGKVGTLTICNSLRNIGYRHVHPHSLRFTRPGVHFLKVDLSFRQKIKYKVLTVLKRAKVAIWKFSCRKIVIITGVRDPYSRNISAYFEQVHYLGGIDNSSTLKDIENHFNEVCIFDAPLTWFDKELKRVTGIDVFSYPFDREKGFCIISEGKYRILVYRIDKLSSLGEEIGQFIGDKRFEILSTNSSEQGQYFDKMCKLKKSYKFDVDKVRMYNESKYIKHFFTASENQKFIERWSSF